MRRLQWGLVLALGGLALTACSADPEEASAVPSSQAQAANEPNSQASPERAITLDPEGEPIDYLTYGAGAFPIRFDPDTQGYAAAAVLDGKLGYSSLSRSPPVLNSQSVSQ